MHLSRRNLLYLPFSLVLHAADGDSAVIVAMRRASPALKHCWIWHRISVTETSDLVLAVSGPRLYPPTNDNGVWWSGDVLLGLFVQPKAKLQLAYLIAVEKGFADGECFVRLERATSRDLVFSRTPEKGNQGPNRRFTYDLRTKALVNKGGYDRIFMTAVRSSGDGAVLVGSNGRAPVAIEYKPDSTFQVLEGQAASRWTSRLQSRPFEPLRFGPENRFTLTQDEKLGIQVAESTPRGLKKFRLPQPTYTQFSAARPGHVKDGYLRDQTKLEVTIGPWLIFEETVWFGQSFYDGEGNSGVGGFGYFDTLKGRFEILAPLEIVNSSVTAILVEQAAVWLATATHGEWGGTSDGLLRFDRATNSIEKIELRDIVVGILRVGGRLLLATSFGPAILEDGKVRRFFVDRVTSGGLRVVEATIVR